MEFLERNKHLVASISIAVIVASCVTFFSGTFFLRQMDLAGLDLLFRLRGPAAPPSPNIIIIEVGDEDIFQVGQWPWKRRLFADMTRALKGLGAGYIYFDFLVSEPSSEEDDDLFAGAIREAGNVYLPFVFPQGVTDIDRAMLPIGKFSAGMKGAGSTNIFPDIDGKIRTVPLFFRDGDDVYHHIALKIAMDYSDLEIKGILPDRLILAGADNEISIPLVEGNKMMLNWLGKWGETFRHYSFADVLAVYRGSPRPEKPKMDPRAFRGSICLVAATAAGLPDIKPVPVESVYPGIGVIATAIGNIVDSRFIKETPRQFNVLFIYLWALIPPLFISKNKASRAFLSLFSAVLAFALAYIFFVNGFRIPFALPLLALLGSHTAVAAYKFTALDSLARQAEGYQKDNIQLGEKNRDLVESLKTATAQKRDLEQINQALDRFVRIVSHDIRSPLQGILGYAALLQKKIKDHLGTKEKEFLDEIFISVDHLNAMMDDLLLTTKISRIKNPYENVSVNELVAVIRRRLEFKIRDSGADLDVQGDLPDIVCDRIKMGEVFLNLIANAIKFSSGNEGVRPKVEIRYRDREDSHEFEIRDNGIGIDPKYHAEIFRMFHRVDQTKHYNGTGVGLSIVQNIINEHGGRVWVESQRGAGAAFFFTIPKNLKIHQQA